MAEINLELNLGKQKSYTGCSRKEITLKDLYERLDNITGFESLRSKDQYKTDQIKRPMDKSFISKLKDQWNNPCCVAGYTNKKQTNWF